MVWYSCSVWGQVRGHLSLGLRALMETQQPQLLNSGSSQAARLFGCVPFDLWVKLLLLPVLSNPVWTPQDPCTSRPLASAWIFLSSHNSPHSVTGCTSQKRTQAPHTRRQLLPLVYTAGTVSGMFESGRAGLEPP